MENRKTLTDQFHASDKKRTIGIIIIALVIALIGVIAYFISTSDNRSITSIEKHIPENASSVFVSEANEEAWQYMNVAAGVYIDYPSNAEYIAAATIENKIVLYVLDETDSAKKIFDVENIEYIEKDKVYAITGNDAHLVDSGIGNNEDYLDLAKVGNNQSFGYVDFALLSKGHPEALKYSFPKVDKWSGSFQGGQWKGKTTNVDFGDLDRVKADEQVVGNPLFRGFADNYKYEHNGDSFTGTFNISDLNALSETKFNTSMRSVEFGINGSSMTFEIR